jgi:hypothetical protein
MQTKHGDTVQDECSYAASFSSKLYSGADQLCRDAGKQFRLTLLLTNENHFSG